MDRALASDLEVGMMKLISMLCLFVSLQAQASFGAISCHYGKVNGSWEYHFGGYSGELALIPGTVINMNSVFTMGADPNFGICGQLTPTGNLKEVIAEVKTYSFTGHFPHCEEVGNKPTNQLLSSNQKTITQGGFVQGIYNGTEMDEVAQTIYIPTETENSILIKMDPVARQLWDDLCEKYKP